MSPAPIPAGSQRGLLMAIGGAEDRAGARRILRHFYTLAGGDDARLVVIPTASEDRQGAGQMHLDIFQSFGEATVEILPVFNRQDAIEPAHLAPLQAATGIFLVGGNQLRFSALLGGTPLAQAIRRANAAGVLIGGTSAGAAVLCEHMIAFGQQGSTPIQRMVNFAPGLGLTNRLIIDQHFSQRLRTGRLMAAAAYNPFLLGVGIDEDTAIIIEPDNRLRVIGQHSVVIVDCNSLEYTDIHKMDEIKPVAMLGVTMHVLVDGYGFDIDKRRPLMP
ncbi:MAG: cyanophycinase [Anaerolineae bacterium]